MVVPTLWLSLLGGVMAAPTAVLDEVQTVVLDASFGGLTPEKVVATLQVADEQVAVVLVDDGTDPHDARGDRVFTGSARGQPVQYLPLTLTVEINGKRQDVYAGTVRIGMERSVSLAFEVTTGAGGVLTGVRRASAAPGRMSHATEAVPLVASAAWAVLALVAGAVGLRIRADQDAAGVDRPAPTHDARA